MAALSLNDLMTLPEKTTFWWVFLLQAAAVPNFNSNPQNLKSYITATSDNSSSRAKRDSKFKETDFSRMQCDLSRFPLCNIGI